MSRLFLDEAVVIFRNTFENVIGLKIVGERVFHDPKQPYVYMPFGGGGSHYETVFSCYAHNGLNLGEAIVRQDYRGNFHVEARSGVFMAKSIILEMEALETTINRKSAAGVEE